MLRRLSVVFTASVGIALLVTLPAAMSACGGTAKSEGFPGGSSGGSGSSGGGSGGSGGGSGGSGSSSGGIITGGSSGGQKGADGGIVCPEGLECNVQCSAGATTKIKGTIYDPAARDPLYNVAVYVPATALQPLPKGLLTGNDACSCSALYQSGAVVNTTTAVDGTFELDNVPVGTAVPLVFQIGKWRKQVMINVQSCMDNDQPDKSLLMPNSVPSGDTITNMPDIAISTGSADSLECLLMRIGLPQSEYMTGGHIHLYSGGNPSGGVGGAPEPVPAGPESDTNLWDMPEHLSPYDIVLLSCEGDETYNANPANLETYLNAGGRVFASHFHYSWFSGQLEDEGQTYTAPTDWGTNLASWSQDGLDGNGPVGGTIVQTLNGSTSQFPKGVILDQWLQIVDALGVCDSCSKHQTMPAADLSIFSPRYNASVTATNVHSQPWIQADPAAQGQSGATMYFSFDTPVNQPDAPDGGPPAYCGRAVFSDLHVGSDPATNDNVIYNADMSNTPVAAPGGCDNGPLSPQEKALEFMLFDLSSCVLPDTIEPPDAGPILQ